MMKRAREKSLLAVVAILLIVLLGPMAAVAQETVTVTLTATQPELTIGDVVPLVLTVTHPAGWRVLIPELDHQWGEFEVVRQGRPAITANADGTETTTQQIDVRLFAVGAFETPALTFNMVDANGQMTPQTAQPVTLTVNSVLTEGDTSLRDIKPQATLEVPGISPLVLGGMALAAVAMLAVARLVSRALRKPKPVVDNRTPPQRAQDELTIAQRLELVAQGRSKELCERVSTTLRVYMEAIYGIEARERTTAEIRYVLRQLRVPDEQVRFGCQLLTDCDFVKFGTYEPSPEDMRDLIERARQFIFMTEPLPDAVGGARAEDAA